MRGILRWFALAAMVLGASCAAPVGREQQRLAVTASTELAPAGKATEDLLPVLLSEPWAPLHGGLAISQVAPAASHTAMRDTPSYTVGEGPGLAPAMESEDAIEGPWHDWPEAGWVAQAGDHSDEPPMVSRSDRRLVTEAWPRWEYPLP
jgi:hypothetical protein